MSSYFGGDLVKGRKIGNTVEIRGRSTKPIPVGTGNVQISSAAVPEDMRPINEYTQGAAYSAGMSIACYMHTTGQVYVGSRNAIAITSGPTLFSITYFVG